MSYIDIIEYTDSVCPVVSRSTGGESTALRALWYNENTRTLIVVVQDSFQTYKYEGVSPFEWESMKASQSPGRYYATRIKPNFGPGTALGNAEDFGIRRVDVGVPAADMGPITGSPYLHADESVGTPKGLTYADDAVVDGIKVGDNIVENPSFVVETDDFSLTTEGNYYSLGINDVDPDDEFLDEWDEDEGEEDVAYFPLRLVENDAPEGVKFLHEVVFVDSENPTKELTRKVEAGSVAEAHADVDEVAEMLDREFIVKRVTVYFE